MPPAPSASEGKAASDGSKREKKKDKSKKHRDDADSEPQAKKCRVQAVSASAASDTLPAIACYFPAGPAPQGASYALYESGSASRPTYTLLGTKEKVTFVGTSQAEEYLGMQASVCSQALAVYDKSTGALQLLPLAGGRVMRMEPRLPGLEYKITRNQQTRDEGPETREEKLADQKALVAKFGSGRRQRQMNAREEGVIKADRLGDAQETLTMMVQGMAQQGQAQGLTRNQAYRADEIIPPDVAAGLRTHLLLKANTDEEALQKLSEQKSSNPYICNRVSVLTGADQPTIKRRAQLLAFLGLLMRLYTGKHTLLADQSDGALGEGMSRLARNVGTTADVLRPLLDLFYEPGDGRDGQLVFKRPDSKRGLMLAYICVVALLAEPDYTVHAAQFKELSVELKMQPADLRERFVAVGAKIKPQTIKIEGGGTERAYAAELLGDGTKTLKEALPAVRMLTKARR